MKYIEAKKALCRKLNIEYSDIANNDLFTLEDIEDFVKQGAMQAYDYEFWDFAEHSKTATLIASNITNGYVNFPTDILPSTIYYLTIDGKEFSKKNFSSYKKYFENNSTATDRFWAEFKRLIFFNVNAVAVGQVMDVYGKRGFRDMSSDNDLMPFSPDTDNEETSGNQACILLAYAEALGSEKKRNPDQAKIESDKGIAMLKKLSDELKQGRSAEQSKDRPMFNVPDMFPSGRSRGDNTIGTFSQ